MALFRYHRGTFEESLETTVQVNSLDDLYELEKNGYCGYKTTDITCEFCGNDQRHPDWKNTYLIMVNLGEHRFPLGWSNAELQ